MSKIIVHRDPAKINLAVLDLHSQVGDLQILPTIAADVNQKAALVSEATGQAISAASTATAAQLAAVAAQGVAVASATAADGAKGVAEAAAVAAAASAARVDLGALDSAVIATAADRTQTGLDRAAAANQAALAAAEKAAAEAARIAAQAAADASIQAGQWDQEVADAATRLALTGLAANWQVYQLDTERVWRWDGAAWVDRGASPLASKLTDRGGLSGSLDAVRAVGVYFQNLSAPATIANGYPENGLTGTLEVYRHGPSIDEVTQRYTPNLVNRGFYVRRYAGSAWSAWERYGAEIVAQLSTQNLDTVTKQGVYYQNLVANATVANGYPIEGATGTLDVILFGSTGSVVQRYTSLLAGQGEWIRRYNGTAWGAWELYAPQKVTQLGASRNLSTVLERGVYFQNIVANASLANGYPVAGVSGVLEVIPLHSVQPWVLQRYTSYDPSQGSWVRTISTTTTAWQHFPANSIQDAPADGMKYARQDGSWVEVIDADITSWKDGVRGLYEKTAYSSFTALSVDPRDKSRVWGRTSTRLAYYTQNGTGAFVDVVALPDDQSMIEMLWTDTHIFCVTGVGGSKNGKVWRSPVPDLSSPSITWTKVFDLADQSGGANSYFREQSLAINPAGEALILEYGAEITGGPSVYSCVDVHVASPVWTKAYQFTTAKHGHSVKWLNGRWWLMNGDQGSAGLGLWHTTDPTTWTRATPQYDAPGGNLRYGINIYEYDRDGLKFIYTDSDTRQWESVLYWPSIEPEKQHPLGLICKVPAPYNLGTVRALHLTEEGNFIWMQIGESGALGPIDSLWIAKGPEFKTLVLLEEWPSPHPLGTMGAPVESGDYIFIGRYRIRKEKFIGQ